MHNLKHRTPISWEHNSNPLVTSWVWNTQHFIVTIYAEGLGAKKMYHWKINDKIAANGIPVPFDSSDGRSFNDCVEAVLEVIGKSYNRSLGYQAYAGSLATTFTVADGRRLDLSKLIGETVTLLARDDSSPDPIVITGMFEIEHYDIVIRADENTSLHVTPSFVLDIKKEYGGGSALDELDSNVKSSRNKSIFYEEWRKGCTGRPGFRPGTVEHAPTDPYCSVHNI